MIFIQTNDPAPWILSDSKDELLAIARIIKDVFGEDEYFESVFHDTVTDEVVCFAVDENKLGEILTPISFIGEVIFDSYHQNNMWYYKEYIENEYGVDLASFERSECPAEQ